MDYIKRIGTLHNSLHNNDDFHDPKNEMSDIYDVQDNQGQHQ
jgi:hypothetical protein